MSILYLLIPLSLLLLSVAVAVFFWAVRSGQFDDLEGPAHRILFDDDETELMPAQRQGDATHDGGDADNDRTDAEPAENDGKPHRDANADADHDMTSR